MHRNFILYKPYGYLSQFVRGQQKRKKKLLGALFPFPEKTMAIGRLDEASEGLLFLTTDGMMSEIIRGKNIEKEYYVQLDGVIDLESVDKLSNGIEISIHGKKYTTKKCLVRKLLLAPELPERIKKVRDDRHGPTSWIAITLTEGKFRQIRKMTAKIGFPALRLVRIRIGNVYIDTMTPGQVVEVSNFETSKEV